MESLEAMGGRLGDCSPFVVTYSHSTEVRTPSPENKEACLQTGFMDRNTRVEKTSETASGVLMQQTTDAIAKIQQEMFTEKRGDVSSSAPNDGSESRSDASSIGGFSIEWFWSRKVMMQLEAGGEEMSLAISQIRGQVQRLALNVHGCRILQVALRTVDQYVAASLVAELHGFVERAINSPHGNFVLQTSIEVLPSTLTAFVVNELTGIGAKVARHKYGCRVLCRLMQHTANASGTTLLIHETLQDAPNLCRHIYGHHVLEAVLQFGGLKQVQQVTAALVSDLNINAENEFATFVISTALRCCEREEKVMIASALLSRTEFLVHLAEHPFGCHVVRALLRLPGIVSPASRAMLRTDIARLHRNRRARMVFAEMTDGS
eukprot:TRINITY_DN64455_c0_g1_i1.p1 TRINITY_DN64455_c0_g1~~TRINITY_DN64455_c0_g1_i1.p1  ORF type:complete len:397 (-),score=47.60 TRINITY_DN64455_c0_g1_i1:4-1134(-)